MPAKPSSARRPAQPRVFKWTATVVGVLATLLALETGLRIYHGIQGTYRVSANVLKLRQGGPYIGSDDPELVYVNRPNFTYEGTPWIESHGVLRPTDVPDEKPPGGLRIAVIGDSVGAGIILPYEQRFEAWCENRLAASLRRQVEALNCCVNGYDTLQEARLLETSVARLHPDAVLVVYCLNDPSETALPLGYFRDPVPPTSYAGDWIRRGIGAAIGRPRGPVTTPSEGPVGPAAGAWKRMYEPSGEGWLKVLAGFDRIADWCRRRSAPVLVAIMPLLLPEDREGASTAAFRSQVADALAARELPFVDLQPVCSAYPVEQIRVREFDIYHLNGAGHAAVQDVLFQALLRLVAR